MIASRDDAVKAAYRSAEGRLGGMPFDAFCDAVAGFDVMPVTRRGQVIGAVFVKGPEIHACIDPIFRGLWLGKREFRLLCDVIARHGFAQTSASTEDGRRFVRRLGFVEGQNGRWVKYGH